MKNITVPLSIEYDEGLVSVRLYNCKDQPAKEHTAAGISTNDDFAENSVSILS